MNDCKLDETVDYVVASRVINTGQVCNAAERVYVQEGIAEEFTKKVIEKMKTLTYGPALAGTFDMGSMVNKAQQEHVDEMVQSAIAEGATVACGGHKVQVDGKGWFYEPHRHHWLHTRHAHHARRDLRARAAHHHVQDARRGHRDGKR